MIYPLNLNIGGEAWNLYAQRQQDPNFKPFQEDIFKRDNHTCQFCGFQSNQHMDIINLDHDYSNNDPRNLATACPLCHQCDFLEMAGQLGNGGGTIIYMTEMTQNQLNALCHVLFCAISTSHTYMDTAHDIMNSLRLRSQYVEKQFGEHLSIPSMLGQMLVDTPADTIKSKTPEILKNLRLLPSIDKFDNLINDWIKHAGTF